MPFRYPLYCCLAALFAMGNLHALEPSAKVEAELWAALQPSALKSSLASEPEVYVVVVLAAPELAMENAVDLAERQRAVARYQEQLITHLDDAFRVEQRYASVAALTGWVTEPGLHALAALPFVSRIGLDGDIIAPLPVAYPKSLDAEPTGGGSGASNAGVIAHIGADAFYAQGITGQGVTVALLDTGVDNWHPDLSDDLIPFQGCFVTSPNYSQCPNGLSEQFGPNAAQDDAGHGTFVAGIVTASGLTTSVIGVAPDAEIVAVKVLDNRSFGGGFDSMSTFVAALDYLITDRPEVAIVNASLSTFDRFVGYCDNAAAYLLPLAQAVALLRQRGTLLVAATGNEGDASAIGAPACLNQVIGVGSSTLSDDIASSSNRSVATSILAPGVAIDSLALGGGEQSGSGTSYATAVVTACIALWLEEGVTTAPDAIVERLAASPFSVADAATNRRYPRLNCAPLDAPVAPIFPPEPRCSGAAIPLANGQYSGQLTAGEGVMYRLSTGAASSLWLETISDIDTFGLLYNSNCELIASDDDSGQSLNFRLNESVTAGGYFLQIRGYRDTTAGGFTLVVAGLESSSPSLADPCRVNGEADSDCDGIPDAVEQRQGTAVDTKDNDLFTDSRLFVMQTYRDFLQREGDAEGVDYWTQRLEQGEAQRTDLVILFLDSPEFIARINTRFPGLTPHEVTVTALYLGMLVRDPDPAGLAYWTAAFAAGTPRQQLIEAFILSTEYYRRFLPG